MFRRLPHSLPPDIVAPKSLGELGYMINENDQIRQIRHPDQGYQYRVNRNHRVNEVYAEAMNKCVRENILERLLAIGLEELKLPIGVVADEKHIPILVSNNIATKKRIIVLFGDRRHELGILSYQIARKESIRNGSVLEFVEVLLKPGTTSSEQEPPGIIVTNPSQLIWYCGGKKAVNESEWNALPRQSAVGEAMRIDEVKNRVLGNGNFVEHVQYVFEHVMRGVCCTEAKFSIIGLEYTGSAAVQYLTNHWDGWKENVVSVALVNPQHSFEELISGGSKSAELIHFLKQKIRAFFLSENPLDTTVGGRDRLGCECYSGGETMYEESVFVRCWRSILNWFDEVDNEGNGPQPVFEVSTWTAHDANQHN